MGRGVPLPSRVEGLGERRKLSSGVRGGAPAENELHERWMRESRCYFFLSYAQNVGVRYPHSKKWGVRVPPVPPVSYAYETINDWQNVTRFANINISQGSVATYLR